MKIELDIGNNRVVLHPSLHRLFQHHVKRVNRLCLSLQQPNTFLERLRLPKGCARLVTLPSDENHGRFSLDAFT